MKLQVDLGANPKLLLISSPGGHVAELSRIEASLGPNADSLWVTAQTPQTESLLNGRRVVWVPDVSPRDFIGALKASNEVRKLLNAEHFDAVVSAGAALASVSLAVAAASGTRTIYIESIARFSKPSVTGTIARFIPRVETWAQSQYFRSRNWRYFGSILDNFSTQQVVPPTRPLRVFVTLGTLKQHRFDRALDLALHALSTIPGANVIWQVGCTARSDLPGEVFDYLTASEMRSALSGSDVVISHAGVGSVLDAFDAGVSPVLIPRSGATGEHVDSHQGELAQELMRRGLARAIFPGEILSGMDLLCSSGIKITTGVSHHA